MLKREGWHDNHKRIYRLYREQGLSLRLKRPAARKSALKRQPQPQGSIPIMYGGWILSPMRCLTVAGFAC